MSNPPHPGLVLREDVLPDLGLSVTGAAAQLGVSRVALSRVINGRAAINADMAIRFAQWLGGSAETWLRAQAQYELWQAERSKRIKVKPVVRVKKYSAAELNAQGNPRAPMPADLVAWDAAPRRQRSAMSRWPARQGCAASITPDSRSPTVSVISPNCLFD